MRATGYTLFLLLAVAVSILLSPQVALASGAFSSRYVDKNFSYSHRDHVRKIFRDGEQSRRYFASKERAFYRHLASVLPAIGRVFGRARRKRIPVSSYSVTLPAIRLPRIQDVARVARSAYPLNLAVQLQSPHGTETLEFSFNRAPRPRDLGWLVSSVNKALASSTQAGDAAPVAVQSSYPAVCKLSGTFGLYVGANVKTDTETRKALEGTFRAELQRLLPELRRKLAHRTAMKELGVTGGLLPVEPLARKRGLPDPCRVFNPHGPLVDGIKPSLVRTSHHKGSMIVIVMIAPRSYDWGKVNPTLTRWLGGVLIGKHHEQARLEQSYLFVTDRGNRHRYRHLSEMAHVRGQRFQQLLSRIILNRDEPSGLREEAARILVKLDPPRPYRTLVRLLATARKLETHDAALAVAVRALSAYPRKRAVDLLIKIRNNKKADWNTRNDCHDALSRIAGKLKDGHPLRKRILALKQL